MKRLFQAAKRLKSADGPSAVGRLLNESPQTLNNWKKRGISAAGAIKAQAAIGCSSAWLMKGLGEMTDKAPPEIGGEQPSIQRIEAALTVYSGSEHVLHPTTLVPVASSLQGLDMSQKNSDLKMDEGYWLTVPGEVSDFTKVVTMPDDSMQPEIYPGEYIAFDSRIEADAGDTVLVVDQDNIVWVRKYRPRTEGRFDAVAINPDHATFNSVDDRVHVFAVLVGHWRGRRSKKH